LALSGIRIMEFYATVTVEISTLNNPINKLVVPGFYPGKLGLNSAPSKKACLTVKTIPLSAIGSPKLAFGLAPSSLTRFITAALPIPMALGPPVVKPTSARPTPPASLLNNTAILKS
jgi:hypothetical protein